MTHLLISVALAKALVRQPPKCIRPKDLSRLEALKTFDQCLEDLRRYCGLTPTDKACSLLNPDKNRFPENVVDIDPKQRCQIMGNGRYTCEQDPIKFVAEIQRAAPAASPSSAPQTGDIKSQAPAEAAPPIVLPPPPPPPEE